MVVTVMASSLVCKSNIMLRRSARRSAPDEQACASASRCLKASAAAPSLLDRKMPSAPEPQTAASPSSSARPGPHGKRSSSWASCKSAGSCSRVPAHVQEAHRGNKGYAFKLQCCVGHRPCLPKSRIMQPNSAWQLAASSTRAKLHFLLVPAPAPERQPGSCRRGAKGPPKRRLAARAALLDFPQSCEKARGRARRQTRAQPRHPTISGATSWRPDTCGGPVSPLRRCRVLLKPQSGAAGAPLRASSRPTSESSPCAVQGPQTPAQTPLQSNQAVCTAFGSRMPHLPRVESLLRLVARQQDWGSSCTGATAFGRRCNSFRLF